MGLTLVELDTEHLPDVNRCDSAFMVDSRLILNAQDGDISYHILSVPAYQKRFQPIRSMPPPISPAPTR